VPLYVAQAAGAAVLEVGTGVTDTDGTTATDVLAACETHDLFPAGTGGVCIFRGIVVNVRHDAGFAVTVTPVVDGQALSAQAFNAAALPAGSDGLVTLRAPIAERGTRISAVLQETAAFGLFEIGNVAAQFVVIRQAP